MYDPGLIRLHRVKTTVKRLREYYKRFDFLILEKYFDELYEDPDNYIEIGEKYKIELIPDKNDELISNSKNETKATWKIVKK